jgi:coenzyme F420-reducing hydrogenase gamma subunit
MVFIARCRGCDARAAVHINPEVTRPVGPCVILDEHMPGCPELERDVPTFTEVILQEPAFNRPRR